MISCAPRSSRILRNLAIRSLPSARRSVHYMGKVSLISMFRRSVSVLVIAGFLANQLAVIPHAHGAASTDEQQKHNATPHLHCEWHDHAVYDHADHDHGHSHSGNGHKGNAKPSSNDSEGPSLAIGLCGVDHDIDVIMVSIQATTASRSQNQVVSEWQFAALAPLPTCLGEFQSSFGQSTRWVSPDKVLDGSDIYLTLRNLRI